MLGESAIDIGGDAGVEGAITASYEIQIPVRHWDSIQETSGETPSWSVAELGDLDHVGVE